MARFMRPEKGTEEKGAEPSEATKITAPPSSEQQRPVSQTRRNTEPSVISASLKVTGNLETDAELQVDGTVEGDVRGRVVTIGEGANILGSVYGETVNVAGTINGKIEARTVMIGKTAHTTGDIIHQSLQIEAGAFVDGHCRPEFGKTETRSATSSTKPTGSTTQPDIKAVDKTSGVAGSMGTA